MFTKRSIKLLLFATAIFVNSASLLLAQFEYRSSWILAGEGRTQRMFAGTRVLGSVDLSMQNLGVMPYIQGEDSPYTFEFNDGYINIPNEDGDFTSEFAFLYENAKEGGNGEVESFTLTRFRSGGVGETYESDFGFSAGWEIGSHYDVWRLTNKISVGFTVAGGFTPLREDYSATITGELFKQTVTVPLKGPAIDYQDSGTYNGAVLGGPYILLNDLGFDASFEERVSQVLADGTSVLVDSEVSGFYELLGGMGTVRFGTYLDYYLTERLMIHLGFGFSASYVSFDFTVDQSLISSTLATPYRVQSTESGGAWLMGAYAELNVVYRFSRKTAVYAGAQRHFIEDFETNTIDETVFDVRLGQPTQFQAGFDFDF